MKRKTKKITEAVFFAILFLILGLSYWLLYTTAGLNWSLTLINKTANSILDYGGVQGAWLKPMDFDYLTVRTPTLDIRGEQLHLDISISNLLSGTLDIEALQTTNLILTSKSPPPQENQETNQPPGKFGLPLGIDVHSLTVNMLHFEQQEQAPIVLENIAISDSRIKRQIDIGSLIASSSYGELKASGSFTPEADGNIDVQTEFNLYAMGQMPQMKGSAHLQGALNDLSLHAQLTHPFAAQVNAALRAIDTPAKWQAQVDVQDAPLQRYFPQVPLALSNVTISGGGDFNNYAINGTATVRHKEFGQWDGKWAVEKIQSQWRINSFSFANPQTGTVVNAVGTLNSGYAFTASTGFSLQADWRNLQWPLNDTAIVASEVGRLDAQGSLNDYQLDTAGKVVWSGHEIENIEINAHGTPKDLTVNQLSADLLKGKIKGSGTLAFEDELAWHADTTLSSIDLNGLIAKLNTKLDSRIAIKGSLKQDQLHSTFAISGLKGKINQQPVAGKAQIALDGGSISVTNVALRSGKSHLKGSLRFNPEDSTRPAKLAADWDVYIHDLRLLTDDLQGSVTSKGSVSGSVEQLTGKADLQASNVQFEQNKIKQVNLDATIDLSEKTASVVSLTMRQAAVAEFPVESLNIAINGGLTQHTIDIALVQDAENQLTLQASGSWQENQWNLSVQETQAHTAQFGNWRQTQSVPINLTADKLTLGKYCMSNDDQGTICAAVDSQHYQSWNGEFNVRDIPFAMFKQLLPPQFDSTNVDINGRGKFSYTAQRGILLNFRASGENGVISGIKVEGKDTPISFNHIEFALSNANQKLEATTSISIQDTGNIDLLFSFPNWSKLSLPDFNEQIQGHVAIDLSNLTVLTFISNQIKDPIGSWVSDIDISGTLGSPVLIGESRVRASSLTLTRLGLKLRDVDLKATSNEKRVVNITGSAKSGKGNVSISGTLNDYRATQTTGTINITGKNFELARIPEATIVVSPDLHLVLNQNSVDATGDIVITEANLKIFTPTKTIAPSPDVVIVSEQQTTEPEKLLNLTSKIRIILGDQVKLQGYGFEGRLEGSVLVDDTNTLTTASGEITIAEGKYAAYGTSLDISSGSLSFAGSSIDNPLVNVRAERRVDNVVAGILVEGNVQSPKISLFSEPAMDDSNILSYIILGQPLNAASDKDGQLLANAAASLGLLGGEKLAKEIGKRFGIDEIKIESDKTTQNTSLVLGKYLSPDFYIGYAIGIGNTVDTLQIQYKLTEQWVLKTQSGEQQKAEILFTIEKD